MLTETNFVSDRLKVALLISDSLVVPSVHGAFNQRQSCMIFS